MPVKEGKAILRVSLDEELIKQLKIAAIEAGVEPHVIVDEALRNFLSSKQHLEPKRGDRES